MPVTSVVHKNSIVARSPSTVALSLRPVGILAAWLSREAMSPPARGPDSHTPAARREPEKGPEASRKVPLTLKMISEEE